MSTADVAKATLAAWEAGDPGQTARLLSDDFALTGPAPVPLDKQAFLLFQQIHNDAFADWKFNPQVVEEQNGRVKLGIQITATHTGTYDVSKLGLPVPPVPATGKRRQWPQEVLTFTIKDGLVTAVQVDSPPEGGVVGTLQWLGVDMPAPAEPSGQDIARRWRELWNTPLNLALVDELVAADIVTHSAPPGLAPGREGIKQWVAIFHQAFPDISTRTEDVIVEGDKVVDRYSGGGTHQGEFFGIPPTGKRGSTTGIVIFRIADGKIVELWGNSDDLGMMTQLGIIPAQ